MSVVRARRPATKDQGQAGQGMVEVALVLPILVVLFMALVELALAFNAVIAVNRASQNGAHLASVAGNQEGADCLILVNIESDIDVPNERSKIQEVVIERTALAGNASYAQQVWTRTGAMTPCPMPDGSTMDLPYVLGERDGLPPYPEDRRCPVLGGCPNLADVPAHSTVDNIGVRVKYRHDWATPLNAIIDVFGGGSTGWTFTQRNIFRIEPTL
jgi:hypothetical protein